MKKLHLEAVVIAEYECEDDEIEGLKHNLRDGILSLYDEGALTDNVKAVCTDFNVSPGWVMLNRLLGIPDTQWDRRASPLKQGRPREILRCR